MYLYIDNIIIICYNVYIIIKEAHNTMYNREYRRIAAQRKTRRIIRNITEGILLLFCFIILPGIAGAIECHYNYDAIVTEVKGDEVLFEDSTGNLWEYEDEGYKVGDKVRLTFYTNHTDNNRLDDEITKIKRISNNK